MILSTLCYLIKNDSYLMLHRVKKQVDVNSGKWIGVGGKFKPGESPEECVTREVYEETGFTLEKYSLRGGSSPFRQKAGKMRSYFCIRQMILVAHFGSVMRENLNGSP